MSKKIVGVTVGTTINPKHLERKLKPVKTVNGVEPDENGNAQLTAEQVGARPDTWMPNAADVGALESQKVRFYLDDHASLVDVMESMDGMSILSGYSWGALSDYPTQEGGRWSIVIFNLDQAFTEISASWADINSQNARKWVGKYCKEVGNGIQWTELYTPNNKPTPADIGAQPLLEFTPIQQGGGARQQHNKIYIGWTSDYTLGAQVDNVDLGDIVTTIPNFGPLVPVYKGGTGAGDAAGARANLGISAPTALDSYPINSIYISYSHTSPASLFGGTWTRMTNTFLWGTDDLGYIGATGGSVSEALTTAQLPNLHGSMQFRALSDGSNVASVKDPGNVFTITADGGDNWSNSCGKSQESNACDLITFNVGEGAAHNNMPPHTYVSIWRRIA